MVIISHVAVGAAIGKTIPNLWFALPFAFISHFFLDMIPHAQAPTEEGYRPNKKTYLILSLDLFAIIVLFLLFDFTGRMLLVIFVSVLPDLLDLTRYNKKIYNIFKPFYEIHDRIQRETNKPIGFLTQITLVVISVLLISGMWNV